MNIGLKHIVELCDYNPEWIQAYNSESRRIISGLENVISLHHVGSTSIPGLCAKPIIDILAFYKDENSKKILHDSLVSFGYTYREDLSPSREYYVYEDANGVRYYSISVYMDGDSGGQAILSFKNNLENDSEVRKKYQDLKQSLAKKMMDRVSYTREKTDFITQHSK